MKRLNLIIVFFVVVLVLSTASTSYGQQKNSDKQKLLGTWVYQTAGYNTVLKILKNNQLIFDGETSSYQLVSNAIRVYDEYGIPFDYKYVLKGDKLTVTFPDGYQYLFVKQKQAAANTTTHQNGSGYRTSSVYGSFCNYSVSSGMSSSYSSSRNLYFDGKGNFAYNTEGSYSGANGGYVGGSNIEFSGTYTVSGKTIKLHFFDGSNYSLTISFVQQSGEITEITYDGKVYAKQLCD